MRSFTATVFLDRVRHTTTVIMLGSLLTLGITGDVTAQTFDYANPLNTARGLSPTMLLRQLNPIETVQTITTPVLDRQAIDREDIKREMSGMPVQRVGVGTAACNLQEQADQCCRVSKAVSRVMGAFGTHSRDSESTRTLGARPHALGPRPHGLAGRCACYTSNPW